MAERTRGRGIRLGLCCKFLDEPKVRFRSTTATALGKLPRRAARKKLLELASWNSNAFREAVLACRRLRIRAYRVPGGLLPLATHPDWLYEIADLPEDIRDTYRRAALVARRSGIRLSFHPDQFVVLGSPTPSVVEASLRDLQLHGELAELLGADVINLHAGGAYGNKDSALQRVSSRLRELPPMIKQRLTLENDDRVYHVRDLLPLCAREGVPLTYDVHHHRCLPDGLSIAEATSEALSTWNREPLFHLSSPKGGWSAENPRHHADHIDLGDFPREWSELKISVDVEAKEKERAVLRLREQLSNASVSVF